MKRLLLCLLIAAGCSSSSESPREPVDVQSAPGPLPVVVNDLGWSVTITRAELHLSDMQFTTLGEAHASIFPNWLVPDAVAHPGHLAGGEVVGELSGTFTVDFAGDGATLGTAQLIPTKYEGMNFVFEQQAGVSFELEGTATLDDVTVMWSAPVTQDENRTVVGIAFDRQVAGDDEPIVVRFDPKDLTGDATVFDGIDFAEDDLFGPGAESSTRLVRSTQRHNFWSVQ